MLESVLVLLTIVSWIYWIIAWWMTRSFFLHPPQLDFNYTPPVSILKPLKGLDYQAYYNFVTFCQQDYPQYELLFAVDSPADDAIPTVSQLQQDFPHLNIDLVITQPEGANRKAGLLHHLTSRAKYDVLVISDSDMRVTPEYLRRVVAPLADKSIGLVTCPYRGESPLTFTARLETLYIGVTFLPSVIVARRVLNMRFAMGATVALQRKNLNRIGGFAAISDYLADDYQLGVHIADLGLRVHLHNYVVSNVLGDTTFQEQWHREVRWAQCSRLSRPWGYPGLLVTFSTPLAALLVLASGLELYAWEFLVTSVVLRWIISWLVTGYTGDRENRRWLFWLPVRDMLTALVWSAGAIGHRVIWRGEAFVLRADGRLESDTGQRKTTLEGGIRVLFDRLMDSLDTFLHRRPRVYEFSRDKACLLSLAISKNDRHIRLSDGILLAPGELIGQIHFWEENLPPIQQGGPDLAWATAFQQQLKRSFEELAAFVVSSSEFEEVNAFKAEVTLGNQYAQAQFEKIFADWGFDLIETDNTPGLLHRFAAFWENVQQYGQVLTLNSSTPKESGLREAKREEFWISKFTLIEMYGGRIT